MNIFVLDTDPKVCAQYHCDKHVIKMILESAQILCTVLVQQGIIVPYKPTHGTHPCTIWAGESRSNFNWLRSLAKHLNCEYKIRFNKKVNHKSYDVVKSLPKYSSDCGELTPFVQVMPEEFKCDNPVKAYRRYYIAEKRQIATWITAKPDWFL